jgi:hypothetical protein
MGFLRYSALPYYLALNHLECRVTHSSVSHVLTHLCGHPVR